MLMGSINKISDYSQLRPGDAIIHPANAIVERVGAKTLEYKTIVYYIDPSTANGEFQKAVNDALADGWTLQGGVSVSSVSNGRTIIAQAVIKYAYTPS